MISFDAEDEFMSEILQNTDLTPAQVVEAEIRAAEIVAQVGYGWCGAYDIPTSWISDEEKGFLDEIASESSLGDGNGGSISKPFAESMLAGELDDDGTDGPVLDLSDEEMEGWRRWSCCGEPEGIEQHAGWLAHQMTAHASVRAGWREEFAPNPWWHPLPWQSDDTTPIDKREFGRKFVCGAYFLAELCEAHFYKPIVDAAAKIHFYWEHRGAYETTAAWVIEMDYSAAGPADHKKFLVAVGSAVRVDRHYQAPFLRSRFTLISRHVLLHDAMEHARKATESDAYSSGRAFWP